MFTMVSFTAKDSWMIQNASKYCFLFFILLLVDLIIDVALESQKCNKLMLTRGFVRLNYWNFVFLSLTVKMSVHVMLLLVF